MRLAVQSGCCRASSAAAPATCGVAIEVPEAATYEASTTWPIVVPAARAATMSTPGAVTSGLTASSPGRGPRPEKSARESSRSTAPTVRAASAAAGDPIVPWPGPALPAATTNSAPEAAESSFSVRLIGSVPSLGASEPSDMLTTSAPRATAHSMPSMTWDSVPKPSSPRTLPISRSAPGATPLRAPPEAAPEPPTIEATWVPCPKASPVPELPEKSCASLMRPDRSGWEASAPVSSTATFTSSPRLPVFQTSGAPICAVLRSSAARTRPSSQTRGTAEARAVPSLYRAVGGGEALPERAEVTGGDADGVRVDGLQAAHRRALGGQAGEAAQRRVRHARAVGDDQRQGVAVRLVVALGDERGHVEQGAVQASGGDETGRVGRQDGEVAVLLDGAEEQVPLSPSPV